MAEIINIQENIASNKKIKLMQVLEGQFRRSAAVLIKAEADGNIAAVIHHTNTMETCVYKTRRILRATLPIHARAKFDAIMAEYVK